MSLRLDFYPLEAHRYSCAHWHYHRRPASGRQVVIGGIEADTFIGTLGFGRGANKDLAKRFGYDQTESCELTRVALAPRPPRRAETTRIVAIALKLLKRENPGLQVVFSFSDPAQSHNGRPHTGGIYRAGGWMFLGMTNAESLICIDGELRHPRTITSRFNTRRISWLKEHVDPNAERVIVPPKFRFAYPLTDEARERLRPHVRPFPKSREQGAESGAPRSRRGSPSLDGAQRRGTCNGICSLTPVPFPVPEARHG